MDADELVFVNEDLVCEEGYLLGIALCMTDRIKQDIPVLHQSHVRVVRCIEVKLCMPNLSRDEILNLRHKRRRYQRYVDAYQELTERLKLVHAELFAGHTASFADFLEEYVTLCRRDGSDVIRSAEEFLGEDIWELIERLREADPGDEVN